MRRRIGLFAVDGVQLLDLSGPADVFAEADRQAGERLYDLSVIAPVPGILSASSGLRVLPDTDLSRCSPSGFDTVLVAGAPHLDRRHPASGVPDWLRAASTASRRTASVCTGAFLLAATGLLDGRRATTHWASADRFRASFPAVHLLPDAIHVADGRFRTAAGVTAGLDLALSLVEEDHGAPLARAVAAQLVMFFRRGGGQLQHGRGGRSSVSGRSALQNVQRAVLADPAAPHGIDALAARAGLSPRHFSRLFAAEIGTTPAAWVEAARIDAARRLLEDGLPPKHVAGACGFADPETFRRAFRRRTGVSPAAYRRTYLNVLAMS
ncbi:MAG: helix-turn-helix domain-containing protein [Gluconacetobacter diazotrophicus]|nr:helix-turn-helix domain-containing protein [Gluconacetobacter diazotrophicus]